MFILFSRLIRAHTRDIFYNMKINGLCMTKRRAIDVVVNVVIARSLTLMRDARVNRRINVTNNSKLFNPFATYEPPASAAPAEFPAREIRRAKVNSGEGKRAGREGGGCYLRGQPTDRTSRERMYSRVQQINVVAERERKKEWKSQVERRKDEKESGCAPEPRMYRHPPPPSHLCGGVLGY